jgi:hypothetical protein
MIQRKQLRSRSTPLLLDVGVLLEVLFGAMEVVTILMHCLVHAQQDIRGGGVGGGLR